MLVWSCHNMKIYLKAIDSANRSFGSYGLSYKSNYNSGTNQNDNQLMRGFNRSQYTSTNATQNQDNLQLIIFSFQRTLQIFKKNCDHFKQLEFHQRKEHVCKLHFCFILFDNFLLGIAIQNSAAEITSWNIIPSFRITMAHALTTENQLCSLLMFPEKARLPLFHLNCRIEIKRYRLMPMLIMVVAKAWA